MKPAAVRKLIERILFERRQPMTTPEIVEMLRFHYGVDVSNQSTGVNLGYLRAAGCVDRRSAPVWGKPYYLAGSWHFSTQNWWWHVRSVDNIAARKFITKIRHEVDRKLVDFQRNRGRPVTKRSKPITDDMRQMIVDLAV